MAMGDNSKQALRRGTPVALAVVAASAAALISGCAGAHSAGAGTPGSLSSASASSGSTSSNGASSSGASSGSAISGGVSSGGVSSGGVSSGGAAASGPAASGASPGATGTGAAGTGATGAPGATAGLASACATPGSYLTAIRTGEQASADRVVFEFTGKPPVSYTVTPVPQVVGDASGKPVAIAGKSFLRVTFRGATAVCPATGHATYPGPSAAMPNYAQLLGLAAAGDFEGYLSWGIGLAARGGYHAYTLTAPYRVVIDIPRP
jgi:hypothetical protein